MDLLNIFNLLSLVAFVALVALAAVRMIWRLGNFVFLGYPVPVLLKRDIVAFSALGLYFGSTLVALATGFNGLSHEPLWVVPRALMVLSAMAYWVNVEYHLEDSDDRE